MKKDIYQSKAWKDIRRAYAIEKHCICERCGRAVYVDGVTGWMPRDRRLNSIVHHKEYLTEHNFTEDSIAYGEDNLELLCIDCHNREHKAKVIREDMMFDETGMPVPRPMAKR